MGLYKLKFDNGQIETGILEKVKSESINYEKDFENWLENSPDVLFDEEDQNTVLWIGRQVTASVGETDKFPDLIGIDSSGDLVIVELKKGKTPREVVAQILEYSAWGASLTYENLNIIAQDYYKNDRALKSKNLEEIFKEVYMPDSDEPIAVKFNSKQRLFIIAEEISPIVRQVCIHLREAYGVNINCMEYEIPESVK